MSAVAAVHTLRRAEALLERLREPEPGVAELLATVEHLTDELQARWPEGKPEGNAWGRLNFELARGRLTDAMSTLRGRGVDTETLRPVLGLVEVAS